MQIDCYETVLELVDEIVEESCGRYLINEDRAANVKTACGKVDAFANELAEDCNEVDIEYDIDDDVIVFFVSCREALLGRRKEHPFFDMIEYMDSFRVFQPDEDVLRFEMKTKGMLVDDCE